MPVGNIEVFSNEEYGDLNIIFFNDEPWFIGNQVATIMGYSNPRDALRKHVFDEDKNTVAIRDGNTRGNPNKTIINESGMYSLMLASKLPGIKKFQHWVTSEVLPSIRKHGAYITPTTIDSIIADPANFIKLVEALRDEQEKRKVAEARSEALQATNLMLTGEVNTWDNRRVLSALVRAFCNKALRGNFQMAWNTLYKRLEYKNGINIRSRRAKGGSDIRPLVEFIRPSEWPKVIQVAAALCKEAGLEPGEIIGCENIRRYLAS